MKRRQTDGKLIALVALQLSTQSHEATYATDREYAPMLMVDLQHDEVCEKMPRRWRMFPPQVTIVLVLHEPSAMHDKQPDDHPGTRYNAIDGSIGGRWTGHDGRLMINRLVVN